MISIYNNKKLTKTICTCHSVQVEIREQSSGIDSSFLPSRFQGPVSGCQAQLFTKSDILRVSN